MNTAFRLTNIIFGRRPPAATGPAPQPPFEDNSAATAEPEVASGANMEVSGLASLAIAAPPPFKKSNPNVQYPRLPLLIGEHALLLSKTIDGTAMVTNFRFCVCERRLLINIPLMAIVEMYPTEVFCGFRINCKDGSSYSMTFATVEDCQQCAHMLREKTGIPRDINHLFAIRFFTCCTYKGSFRDSLNSAELEQLALCKLVDKDDRKIVFGKEMIDRQGFDINKRRIWRICHANEDFEFCSTYPQEHIMPSTIDDDELRRSLDFRDKKRFPSVVWRHRDVGVVLIRSSQPMGCILGFGYYSNQADISLLARIVDACHREREAIEEDRRRSSVRALMPPSAATGDEDGAQGSLVSVDQSVTSNGSEASNGSHNTPPSSACSTVAPPAGDIGKLAVVDCRSVAGSWGNSIKGGGTEDELVYRCSVTHLDLANIHAVRDSLNKLRNVCISYAEGAYLNKLSSSMWLNYIAAILRGANKVVELMHVKQRPVLVHCSDGWDRTAQICSLSELMMDSYYRTIPGFKVLVEREWLWFGHKFGERGGHDPNCTDTSQISPIFLQFLDCVHQLCLQYPAEFQFNEAYLVKLLQHSQACLFGTFLHNCERERVRTDATTASVWTLLTAENTQFVNLLYRPHNEILTAKHGEHDVMLWKKVYMAGLSPGLHNSHTDFHMEGSLTGSAGDDGVTLEGSQRSRSMEDLTRANSDCGRRNSDPMVTPNPQEMSAASAPSTDTHDTSTSSAEMIQYTDLEPPARGSSGADGGSGGATTEDVVESTQIEPSSDVVEADSGHAANGDISPETPDAEAQPTSEGDLVSKAQSLTPSSSSVFSEVDESSMSASEHTLCQSAGNSNMDVSSSVGGPAQLPAVVTSMHADSAAVENADPTGTTVPETSSSQEVCKSGVESVPPEMECSHSNPDTGKDNGSVSHSSYAAMVSSSSVPAMSAEIPHSSSPSGGPGKVQTSASTSSLLSERLARTEGSPPTQSAAPATNGKHSHNGLDHVEDNHKHHSSQQQTGVPDDINDITSKLKAGALLNSSKTVTVNGGGRPVSNGTSSNHSPPPARPSTTHSLTAVSARHPRQSNGEENDGPPRAMTDSTDTLVDQPVGTDIPAARRHSRGGGGSARNLDSINGAAGCLDPALSYSSPSLLSEPRGVAGGQSRRARAASGASRDVSVSPREVSHGAWADTQRLRNQSGGGEVVARRCIAATVATSTSDISDSFVGRVPDHNTVAMVERGPSVRQHLDVDGLVTLRDERQDLLGELVAEKDRKIADLENRLRQAIDIIQSTREQQRLHYTPTPLHINGHANFLEELSITEAEGGELSSLGTVSNAASDGSWENIDEGEERIIKWMPDSMVTHCAGCDGQFWVAKRKHHCRNCGKVFCWDCSNYLAPVPHQHLNKPQRVCSRCHSMLLQLSPGASSDGRIPTLVADG